MVYDGYKMKRPDLLRLLELQKLLQAFGSVDRVVERDHGGYMRPETDVEHSYNLAMTAWFLAPHFPQLSSDKVIRYALVHDLVEVHAGDTYIYGSAADLASKHNREAAAAKQLAKEWADFPDIHELIGSYEARDTAEGRFVYALDKLMPVFAIYIHEGYTWKKEGITVAMLDAAKRNKVALSPEIQPYFEDLMQLLLGSPHLLPPK